MITRPLDLQSRLAGAPRDMDVFFWCNTAAVCLFFSLLGSKFVLAPGVPVGVGEDFELPRVANAVPGAADVVVSYRRDNMILFEGGIFELAGLREVLARYAREHAGSQMIVRVDQQVSMQGFLELCDLAKDVGFRNVLVATLEEQGRDPQFVQPGR